MINKLDNFEAEKIPPKISKEAFLESGFDEIVNKQNLLAHFKKKQDKSGRLEFLNLVEPTRVRPNAILKTKDKSTDELRKAFLKVFDGEKKKKFYVLFTQIDDEKIAITGIPMSEKSKIKKLIREALEVLDDKNKSRGLSKTLLALLNAPKGVNLRFNKQIITQILRKCQGG